MTKTLTAMGYSISPRTVAHLLQQEGYSLQGNTKTREGTMHPDRDQQFRYLNDQVQKFLDAGNPVVSVDVKKKVGKAIPHGIYDVAHNLGWVTVGQDHDTAGFAVESLRRWWRNMGQPLYPEAKELLICADGGGSNGYRVRLWKAELARWAQETGLSITVCHLPPGTSKWNKIEHRLFSHISMNWRGRPLESHEVVVDLIRATTTSKGLRVQAELDTNTYPTKVRVPDEEFDSLPITRHDFHGEWNYTIQ